MINIGKAVTFAVLFICCSAIKTPINTQVQKVPPVEGIRIAWDHSTLRMLSRPDVNYSGYARMIRLHNGSLICVYESAGNIECIRSNGDIKNWSQPVIVAKKENQIARCVPDILEKEDRSLLLSYNLRPDGNNTDSSKRFSIRVKHSTDGGHSWINEKEIYRAGHEFKNGCWEPSQVQLPLGEIQLFIANEGPYTHSDEQEITVFRSFDGGYSWTKGETASFRKGFRDGMPVPLFLRNSNEIIFSIEDNGIATPQFKPVIIRTSLADNWRSGAVTANHKNRNYTLDKFNIIPPEKYAGGPYIRQLGSGEVLLSYQGDELRQKNQWDLSDMIVCIGDSTAHNFNRKSLPFYTTDPAKTCLWNSLTIESDSTVIALASTNAYGKNTAVWMIRGHILKNISCRKGTLTIDGNNSDALYSIPRQIFIGGYGSSNVQIRTCYDDRMLYISAIVDDSSIYSTGDPLKDDGIMVSIDPGNRSLSLPDKGIYAVTITAGNKAFFTMGEDGEWINWNADGIKHSVKTTVSGYLVEVGISWKALGGIPRKSQRIGFNASLNEAAAQNKTGYSESINGNDKDKPFTWSSLYLQ